MIILYCVSANEEFNKLLEKYNNEIKIGNELLIENIQLIKQTNNLKSQNDKLSIENDKLIKQTNNLKNKIQKDMKIYEYFIHNKQEFEELHKDVCNVKVEYFKNNNNDPYFHYINRLLEFKNQYNNILKELSLVIMYVNGKYNREEYEKNKTSLVDSFYYLETKLVDSFYYFVFSKIKPENWWFGNWCDGCCSLEKECATFISFNYCTGKKLKLLEKEYASPVFYSKIFIFLAESSNNPELEVERMLKNSRIYNFFTSEIHSKSHNNNKISDSHCLNSLDKSKK